MNMNGKPLGQPPKRPLWRFMLYTTTLDLSPMGHSLKVIVRPEEILIVGLVLLLWAGAIMLFFNRWGKIRMLEPYQPKFQQQHRSSCPMVDIEALAPIIPPSAAVRPVFNRSTMGVSLPNAHFGSMAGSRTHLYAVRAMPKLSQLRQNSVFIGPLSSLHYTRKTKSAADLSTTTVPDEAVESV